MRHDAVVDNWIKAYPCCLQTHTAIDAALQASGEGAVAGAPVGVRVHPLSRKAAPLDGVSRPLETKFSIPYLTAFVLARGRPPAVVDLEQIDPDVAALVSTVTVMEDPELPQSTAVLLLNGVEVRCDAAVGSPNRPMSTAQHAAKIATLDPRDVVGLLDDPTVSAGALLSRLRAGLAAG